MSKPHISQGFTLIEFVILLVILGILYFSLTFYPGTGLNIEPVAQMFASTIRYTQNLAMTRGQVFYLSIDSSTTYSIRDSTGAFVTNPATGGTTMNLGKLRFSSISNLPNNVITFSTHGQPYVDTAATTPLSSSASVCFNLGNESKCVSISPETGYVTS